MSIVNCGNCNINIDTDFDAEHEEECEECTHCNGEGIVPCDGFDEESGRYINGINEQPCICQM